MIAEALSPAFEPLPPARRRTRAGGVVSIKPLRSSSLDPEKQASSDAGFVCATDVKRWNRVLRIMPFYRPTPWAEEIRWHHSFWEARRNKVIAAMKRARVTPARFESFQCCGTLSHVERSESTGAVRVVGRFCHDRMCARCGNQRGAVLQRTVQAACDEAGTVRLLTLTLAHEPGAKLGQRLDRLYECFRRLRQRREWKEHVRAALAVCEIKIGKLGQWHTHFHVVLAGKFWSQAAISAEWAAVTGDSRIVDIRVVPNQQAAGYVSKYLSKPIPSAAFDDLDRLVDAIEALKGRRLLIKTGDWHGHDFEPQDDDEDPGPWKPVGLLAKIIMRARAGDAMSRMYLELLRPKDDDDPDLPPPRDT